MSYEFQNKDLFGGSTGLVEASRLEELMIWREFKQCNLSQGDWYLSRADAGDFFDVFGNKAKTE